MLLGQLNKKPHSGFNIAQSQNSLEQIIINHHYFFKYFSNLLTIYTPLAPNLSR